MTQLEDRIGFLRSEIKRHNDLYFKFDNPEISDAAYDLLLRELEKLENDHPELKSLTSPSKTVGAAPEGRALSQVKRDNPMLSLDKAMNESEIFDFEDRVVRFLGALSPPTYHTMPKFDGLAVELCYEQRKLNLASTRGDGTVGENITSNVNTIEAIPKTLPPSAPEGRLSVRGEVYMEKKDFLRLNEEREADGESPFANPRNAAAGSLRQLDSSVTKNRKLSFFAYGLNEIEAAGTLTYSQLMKKLALWGFPVESSAASCEAKTIPEVIQIFKRLDNQREALPYEIDGLVVTVDELSLWKRLGATSRAPRYAVAVKFKPRAAQTKVLNIEVQVGRTGALTPVAVMAPVEVGGVTISQATLHNEDELKRKDVREGDLVKVHRAGDVIPEIIEVVLEARPPHSAPFIFPKNCPICGTTSIRRENEAVARCPNRACPAQIEARLIHFASKNALDIEGLGPKLANQLLSANLIERPSDLFRLSFDKVKLMPRFGEKSAQNLIEAIDKARTKSLWRFINSLSIRHVGERSSQILADHFKSLAALAKASVEELKTLNDVGPEVAQSVVDFFQSPLNTSFVSDLLSPELNVSPSLEQNIEGGPLTGKRFVLTGTLSTLTRAEAKARVTTKGGRVLSSVSKETDYLVAGEAPGSKLSEARKFNVTILDEEAFLKLLGQ